MRLGRICYRQLNTRQKEIYNFQKVSGRLADYGFNCMWLSDDWQGADCLACHLDGRLVLRVQLKGRMALDKKYIGKDISIAFRLHDEFYLYLHDDLLSHVQSIGVMDETSTTWTTKGFRHWPRLPKWAFDWLSSRKI